MPAAEPDAEAMNSFEAVAVLWLVGEGRFSTVVETACSLLVAGGDGEALASLAGEPPNEPVYPAGAEDAVRQALAEQGRPLPPGDGPAVRQRAILAMARRVAEEAVPPRYAANWAHSFIGHDGPKVADALVEADDRYDLVGTTRDTTESLDREVIAYCRLLIQGG